MIATNMYQMQLTAGEVKGEAMTYPTCTNCGIDVYKFVEQQNFAEESEEEIPEVCCGVQEVEEEVMEKETVTEEVVVEQEEEKKTMDNDTLMLIIQVLTNELNELKGTNVVKTTAKKNQRPGKAAAGRKYVLLSNTLSAWGKVPQQQADIAKLLAKSFKVGVEVAEDELFTALVDGSGEYNSLYTSKQDPTYLFRYYRGLKNDGKHAGLIARNFIKQIG